MHTQQNNLGPNELLFRTILADTIYVPAEAQSHRDLISSHQCSPKGVPSALFNQLTHSPTAY